MGTMRDIDIKNSMINKLWISQKLFSQNKEEKVTFPPTMKTQQELNMTHTHTHTHTHTKEKRKKKKEKEESL